MRIAPFKGLLGGRGLRAIAVFLGAMMVAASLFADRPAPEEVAAAVERSKARYRKEHGPLTKEEFLAQEESRLTELGAERKRAIEGGNKSHLHRVNQDIAAVLRSMDGAKRKYEPHPVPDRLSGFGSEPLELGMVGRIEVFRAIKVLDEDRVLGEFGQLAPNWKAQGTVVFAGLDTSKIEAGKVHQQAGDFVVADRYTATAADGTLRMVFVLEKFHPNRPWR